MQVKHVLVRYWLRQFVNRLCQYPWNIEWTHIYSCINKKSVQNYIFFLYINYSESKKLGDETKFIIKFFTLMWKSIGCREITNMERTKNATVPCMEIHFKLWFLYFIQWKLQIKSSNLHFIAWKVEAAGHENYFHGWIDKFGCTNWTVIANQKQLKKHRETPSFLHFSSKSGNTKSKKQAFCPVNHLNILIFGFNLLEQC